MTLYDVTTYEELQTVYNHLGLEHDVYGKILNLKYHMGIEYTPTECPEQELDFLEKLLLASNNGEKE